MKPILLLLLIIGIAYLLVQLNIAVDTPSTPGIIAEKTEPTHTEEEVEGAKAVVEDKNPLLNESQEKALETFGIDPASVPSSISPEQEQCFVDALGQERVDEIKAGAAPTPTDLFKARACVQL